MIQTNQLRIGNIVRDRKTDNYYCIRVLAFNKPSLERLEPIKLTEQLLINCGFKLRKKTEDGTIYGLLNTTIIYTRSVGSGMCFFLNGYHNDVHIEFLHQLQNLFFLLTGNELAVALL